MRITYYWCNVYQNNWPPAAAEVSLLQCAWQYHWLSRTARLVALENSSRRNIISSRSSLRDFAGFQSICCFECRVYKIFTLQRLAWYAWLLSFFSDEQLTTDLKLSSGSREDIISRHIEGYRLLFSHFHDIFLFIYTQPQRSLGHYRIKIYDYEDIQVPKSMHKHALIKIERELKSKLPQLITRKVLVFILCRFTLELYFHLQDIYHYLHFAFDIIFLISCHMSPGLFSRHLPKREI